MGYQMRLDQFNNILTDLQKNYVIWAPKLLPGQGLFSGTDLISYGTVDRVEQIVFDQKTTYSAKEAIFPPGETLFYFTPSGYQAPEPDQRGLLIFARSCDIHAFQRLDDIFLHNGPHRDYYYQRQRQRVKFVLLECEQSFDSCFCVSMGTNKTDDYSLAIRLEEGQISCQLQDDDFAVYFAGIAANKPMQPRFVTANHTTVTIPTAITPAAFDLPLWEAYNTRCSGCGRCNLACPTCSCFTMQDIFYQDNPNCGERRRVWASCMIDGFTQLAGGHNFRSTKGERMRFKLLHKIHDFKQRFGYHMCVGCGRCDDICQEYISFAQCIRHLHDAVQGGAKA